MVYLPIIFRGGRVDKLKTIGIVVPLLTPFRPDGSLDEPGLRHLTRRMITAGVHGVFPVGSSGEFWVLNDQERRLVIKTVVDEIAGAIPVYVGVGAIGTRQVIEYVHMAEQLGADAVVAVTPFYISLSQKELYTHYAAIARSTSLPVLPYNNPGRTGNVNLEPATVARLSEIENLVGIKDSSGNLGQTADYINLCRPGFAVFQGRDDIIFPSLVLGAVGGVAAEGNVAPELCVDMYHAFLSHDWEKAKAIQAKLALLRRALAWGTYPAPLKAAMEMICESAGDPRPPAEPLPASYHNNLRNILVQMGLRVTDSSTPITTSHNNL
jgi:4-hydroxy-tetrahydrodipicolinate synthase